MLVNYVKVAYRNLIRSKLYTAISVVGLAAGIACCILIFLTDMTLTVFILAGLVALTIAVLTVSYQVIKAALANPVETLRYE